MSYAVKEIFYTLEGEGANTGRAAVFVRFAGCNLWSGREQDRESAVCQFCDTDFVGTDGPHGGKFNTPVDLASAVQTEWRAESTEGTPLVICTGGEPLLQLDTPLIEAFHEKGFEVAIETNGTLEVPAGIEHVCVSPKAGADLVVHRGNELKLVFPQPGAEPERFDHLEFDSYYLQPMDGPAKEENSLAAVRYCMAHPKWRLSVQMHKILGIP